MKASIWRTELWRAGALGSVVSTLALASCSNGASTGPGAPQPTETSGSASAPAQGETASSGSVATAGVTSSPSPATASPSVSAGAGDTAPVMSDGPSSTGTASSICGGVLPPVYTTICSGCHTKDGTPNALYPDLYTFKGTEAQFLMFVRTGGSLPTGAVMAPYPATLVPDADVSAIYTYFTTSTRGTTSMVDLGSVRPLFSPSDAVNPPIVFKRDDGALVTRGAGRPRDRHEGPLDTNVPFMEFGPDYFFTRSYGWIVEDYTPTGKSLIRVTYLPYATPQGGTNFRCWKMYGNGDIFTTNAGMNTGVGLPDLTVNGTNLFASYQTTFMTYAQTQQQETTTNTRTGKPIQAGDLFEFEFGIFIDHGAVQPTGSRTNYYTDTYRYQVGQGGVTPDNPDPYSGGKGTMGPAPAAQQGGGTTNVWPYFMFESQFGQIALDVQHENEQHVLMGRRLFHTDFVTGEHSEPNNPVFTEQMGKAGPPNVSTSCENCHISNGPGQLLQAPLSLTSSMSIKFVGGSQGHQLELQSGSASVTGMTAKSVTLGDGTVVMLSKPQIAVTLTSGAMPPPFSARIARKVIGMGLLEAMDERTILSHADPTDCDGNGVKGRANFVKDPSTGDLRIGRFGWKAEKVTVEHQVAEALSDDMGVGTTLFPNAASGRMPLSDDDLSHLVAYMRLVAVPGQRTQSDTQVRAGEVVFKTIGCSNCHLTDSVTGPNHPFVELRNQSIKPYTDLLLHDMGPDLADDSQVPLSTDPMAPPAASEWRTPPLWGTGLLGVINGHSNLLHDGRAANPTEAVLWHGGEAATAQKNFTQLSAADRAALLAFLGSI